MKKVCITGADGFIGSHLAEFMAENGYAVRAFVQYNSRGSRGWLDESPLSGEMEFFAGDVRDPHLMLDALKGCGAVLHLAALIAIPYSYAAPDSYVDTNVKGTLNVLQAARQLELERIVCTSTSEVYGTAQFVPITENHPLSAQSPYAASKIGADQLALGFSKSFGLPVSVLRPFNTYGPRQSARAFIPTVITQILGGSQEIRLGSLSPTRDFSYVLDMARAFEAVMNCDAAIGHVLNAGSGFEISMGQTADIIAEIMGRKIEVVQDSARVRPEASEVRRLFAGTEKIERLCGWKPAYGGIAGFRLGMAKTVEWFSRRENKCRYRPGEYAI